MTKQSLKFKFPPLLLPDQSIISPANKLLQIQISNSSAKLISSYGHILRRLFSQAMKTHDYDTIAYYVDIGVPIHFGKSLRYDFISDTCPLPILHLLIEKT